MTRRQPAAVAAALVLVFAGALMAWQVAVIGLAEHSARNRVGSVAYQLRPQNARGAALAAAESLALGDVGEAERRARRAILFSPIEVIAVRTLGEALNSRSHGRGDDLMITAGRLSWRDNPTQLWLIDRALRAGELEIAVQRAEALLRSRYETRLAFGLFRLMVHDQRGRHLIVQSLAGRPFWRHAFLFTDLEDVPELQVEGMARLLHELADTEAPPTIVEARATIDALVRGGREREAFRLYRRVAGRGSTVGLSDGDFAPAGDGSAAAITAFDWRFHSTGGSTAGVEALLEEGANRVIYAIADGTTSFRIADRILVLDPGSYAFAYRMRSADPGAPAALQFSLRCSQRPLSLLATAGGELPGGEWVRRSHRFTVPAEGCEAQVLELQAQARLGGEVEAFFDDVTIRRVGS